MDITEQAGGHFRVVELNRVTDEEIERVLNAMHDDGYALHDMRFAMQQGVRRPAMAFLIFERTDTDDEGDPQGV